MTVARVHPFGRPPRRESRPATARQIRAAVGATPYDVAAANAALRMLLAPCATCGKRDPAHGLAWVSTGDGTRHGHHYNDRDRPAGRSPCGRPLPRGVRCVGGIHGGARNCKTCLRVAKAAA